MKSSKERKMERKRKNKELSATKTVKSRQRRLDNKAKRDAIHDIDPDMKVKVIDQVTCNEYGIEIMVENGKIKCVPTVKVFNPEIEEVEAVEVNDISKFQELVNKWRL